MLFCCDSFVPSSSNFFTMFLATPVFTISFNYYNKQTLLPAKLIIRNCIDYMINANTQ